MAFFYDGVFYDGVFYDGVFWLQSKLHTHQGPKKEINDKGTQSYVRKPYIFYICVKSIWYILAVIEMLPIFKHYNYCLED